MEKEPSTKFYGVLIIFQEVMKLRTVEGIDVSDVIPANVHNMCFSAVHNIFGRKTYLVWEFRKMFTVFLGSFYVFVSFTLETVIYDEQKWQVVR